MKARRFCRYALDRGVIPIAPHLLFPQFLDELDGDERELGLMMGLALLDKCKELWYFGSYISFGMQAEIKRALRAGIRVRQFTDSGEEVVK
jgi:hypothetical protein